MNVRALIMGLLIPINIIIYLVLSKGGRLFDSTTAFITFRYFSIALFIFSVVFFILIKFYSLSLYKKSDDKWKSFFYFNYILLFSSLLNSNIFSILSLLVLSITLFILIIVDIILLFMSYKSKPRLAYFYNQLIIFILIIILSIFPIIESLGYF